MLSIDGKRETGARHGILPEGAIAGIAPRGNARDDAHRHVQFLVASWKAGNLEAPSIIPTIHASFASSLPTHITTSASIQEYHQWS